MDLDRTSINSVGTFPPNTGFRQVGDSITEAIVIVDATPLGLFLEDHQAAAWQLLIDTGEAWRRGEVFSVRTLAMIRTGRLTLARRSYHRRRGI